MNETKTIQLTRGAVALVSVEDYEMLSRHKWHATHHGYAARHDGYRQVYMHREVNRTPDGFDTDHIDGNKLNNTRANLRTATTQENSWNASKQKKGLTSQFKGVCIKPGCGKDVRKNVRWIAYISVGGKRTHLGYYATELDAALRYNIECKKLFGEFAKLNTLPLDWNDETRVPVRFQEPKHSRYFGVSKHKASGLWTSNVTTKEGRKIVKYFRNEDDAARDYDKTALRIHGDKARLNAIPCDDQKESLCPTTTLAT